MSVERVKQRLQAVLKQRGYGLLGLLNSFQEFDLNGDGELSWDEFHAALLKSGLNPSPQDARALFTDLDSDASNSISYNEFIASMRGNISLKRRDIISRVFITIDRDGDGIISMSDIGSALSPKDHPDVKAGRITTSNFLNKFFDSFNIVTTSGLINLEQFIEYYTNVAAFDDDSTFESTMNAMWRAPSAPAARESTRSLQSFASQSLQSKQPLDLPEMEQLRSQLFARGTRGIVGLQRKFRILDDDGSGAVNLAEFKKGIRESGLQLNELQINTLFCYFDKDRSGSVSFDEFIQGIRVSSCSVIYCV